MPARVWANRFGWYEYLSIFCDRFERMAAKIVAARCPIVVSWYPEEDTGQKQFG
jgi:hypothetical protein